MIRKAAAKSRKNAIEFPIVTNEGEFFNFALIYHKK